MPRKLEKHSWEVLRECRRWSTDEGRWVVAELRRSRLSAKQFAEKHEVAVQRVYYWCARLKGDEQNATSDAAPGLVEVGLPAVSRALEAHDLGRRIEIELLSGRRMSVPEAENLNLEQLAALVTLLERC